VIGLGKNPQLRERPIAAYLDAISKLAVALSVSADVLLFAKDERGPDEDLKLQFEARKLDRRNLGGLPAGRECFGGVAGPAGGAIGRG
jgi:hypothetical protein